jgi:hypothetical protein
MKRGDLVKVRGGDHDVPLYPEGKLASMPFFCPDGDVVMLVNFKRCYANILHPRFGRCSVSRKRLESINEIR